MSASSCLASACRYCRHFTPEGRRGGNCQQLGVPVRGNWKACALAMPPFAPSWENSEAIPTWQGKNLMVKETISLERFNVPVIKVAKAENTASDEGLKTRSMLV